MNERIKKLRKSRGLTQQEFADRLHIKRGAIANYEIGRNEPTDSVIALICREFGVREEWLRTGEEPMEYEVSMEAKIGEFFKGIQATGDFRERFVLALSRLTVDEWRVLEKLARECVEQAAPAPKPQEESTEDDYVEAARQHYRLEKKGTGKSSASSSGR